MAVNVDKYFKPDMKQQKKRTKNEVVRLSASIDDKFNDLGKNQKYYIRTYGCQMNEHDTETMAGILHAVGYSATEVVEEANVIIFNTCAIRANAENKVFGEIGRLSKLKQDNPDLIFAVCGCMSQEEDVVNKLLKTYTFVDLIFGTHNIHRLPNLLNDAMMNKERVVEVWNQEGEIIEDLPKSRANKTQAWVNIIYGCDKFCTYCIVPYTRGKERSRDHVDILNEVKQLKEDGYLEVTLLGQNVNAYGKDRSDGYLMANLLEDVAKIGIERIRFMTSHPWDFDDEMIDVIKKYDNIMPSVHLPVQSGNSDILKIMGRSYTREQYLELFHKLRAAKPTMSITTDIIVGYPNETDEQFEDTMTLYEECKFDTAFTFIYSPREGTPAAKMDDNVSEEVKKERLYRLNEVVVANAKQAHATYLGEVVEVLPLGPSTKDETILSGYSRESKLVLFKAGPEYIGKLVKVRVTETKNTALIGELCEA